VPSGKPLFHSFILSEYREEEKNKSSRSYSILDHIFLAMPFLRPEDFSNHTPSQEISSCPFFSLSEIFPLLLIDKLSGGFPRTSYPDFFFFFLDCFPFFSVI